MSNKLQIVSVLSFPYDNVYEIRVSRAYDYNTRIWKINIYHAKYTEESKLRSLVKWAAKLQELVMLNRVEQKIRTSSPTV